MISEIELVALEHLNDREYQSIKNIFDDSFSVEERVPFEDLSNWLDSQKENARPFLGGVKKDGEMVGLVSFLYFVNQNLVYCAYLAIRGDQRGKGIGEWTCEQMLAKSAEIAKQARGEWPRFAFWEVRDPADAPDQAEEVYRQRRIEFYKKVGAYPLPVNYICPPVSAGQPPVKYLLMVRTFPPGRMISRDEAVEAVWTGLVTINKSDPDSENVKIGERSIDVLYRSNNSL